MAAVSLLTSEAQAQLSITSGNAAYTQNFNSFNPDSLTNLGSTIPTGWVGTGFTTYNGRSTGTGLGTGGYYAFGTGSDFSLGAIRSGTTANVTYTASFTNSTGLTIQSLTLGWNYEQWRFANTSGWNATGTGALNVAAVNSKDFTGTASGTNGTVSTTAISTFDVTSLSIANSGAFGISWITTNESGADNGVAIDDFAMNITRLATSSAATTVTSLAYGSGVTVQNGHSAPTTLTVNLASNEIFAGLLENGGSHSLALSKSGAATLTLSNANTYTGGTTVSAGTLTLGHATNTLANTGSVLVSGGILNVANPDTVGAVTLSSGSISGAGTLTGSSYALTNTGTISATLAGAVTLTKTGAGTATISSANTYSGGTTISTGTLNITNGSGSATGTGALTLDSTGTLSGTGIIAPAINTNINLNGSLIVGDTTLGSPVASSITLTTSGSGITTTSTSSLFHFDLFTRIGGANPLGSAADYIKLPGTLNNTSVGPNLGTIVITNQTGGTTFALGDSWHLFDFTGGGTITDDFNVDYTNLGLSGDLIGQFDRLSGTFSIVPEPSRTLFLALGLLTLTLRRRR